MSGYRPPRVPTEVQLKLNADDDYRALADVFPGVVRRARTGSSLAAARLFCLTCTCADYALVKYCETKNCPLWPYRMGRGFQDPGLYVPPVDKERTKAATASSPIIKEIQSD